MVIIYIFFLNSAKDSLARIKCIARNIGFPLPTITWTKNGQEVTEYNGTKLSYDHNHVKLEIKDVKVKDAGRYTCTAKNEMGNASSTADLVVKSMFFGNGYYDFLNSIQT